MLGFGLICMRLPIRMNLWGNWYCISHLLCLSTCLPTVLCSIPLHKPSVVLGDSVNTWPTDGQQASFDS
jgi:hypothetical protein